MSRVLDDWLGSYIEYGKIGESPLNFHIWTGLSVLASCLERRCYMYWPRPIYPNMYVILIGPSGRSRKGEAINTALDIVRQMELHMASSSMTREAMIQTMISAEESYTDATTQKPNSQCAVYCVSGELSVLLGQRDIKFLADLTDWYDALDTWQYRTRTRGKEEIHGVCLNILGASAQDWLGSIFPSEAIGGGFTSRCILVVERNKGKIVADPTAVGINFDLRDQLIADLKEIKKLSGEMRFTDEAKEDYITWYKDQEEKLRRGISPVKDNRFAGYVSRRATHLKKVCMALSASRGDDMAINCSDFKRGVAIIAATEKNMSSAFETVGEGKFTKQVSEILIFIKARKKTSRSEILKKFYLDVDGWIFERIEVLLQQMKVIKVIIDPAVDDKFYEYIGEEEEESNVVNFE